MAKIGNYKVPFSVKSDGSVLLHHFAAKTGWYAENVEWRENTPFAARINLMSMKTGYSAKYVLWEDVADGSVFPMFIADLMDLVQNGVVHKGVAEHLWWVRKRGQNFGLRMYRGENE